MSRFGPGRAVIRKQTKARGRPADTYLARGPTCEGIKSESGAAHLAQQQRVAVWSNGSGWAGSYPARYKKKKCDRPNCGRARVLSAALPLGNALFTWRSLSLTRSLSRAHWPLYHGKRDARALLSGFGGGAGRPLSSGAFRVCAINKSVQSLRF